MIRKLLCRILGPPTGDIYIVIDTGYTYTMIVGASTRQQGAERIRAEYAEREARQYLTPKMRPDIYQKVYDRTIIENHELRDGEA